MGMLEVTGARLNVQTWGHSGPWITMINGHTRSHNDFKMIAQKIIQLGYRIITLDNRGSGSTQCLTPFTFEDLVEDVVQIWRASQINSSVVIGISMGGFITQALAVKSPVVNACVLISTASKKEAVNRDPRPWSNNETEVIQKLSAYFAPDFPIRNPLLIKSMAKQIVNAVSANIFAENAKRQDLASDSFDLSKISQAIEIPTIIIHGDQDAIIPLQAAYALKQIFVNSSLSIIPNSGHLLLAERSKELFGIISNFLVSINNTTTLE